MTFVSLYPLYLFHIQIGVGLTLIFSNEYIVFGSIPYVSHTYPNYDN